MSTTTAPLVGRGPFIRAGKIARDRSQYERPEFLCTYQGRRAVPGRTKRVIPRDSWTSMWMALRMEHLPPGETHAITEKLRRIGH